MRLGTAGERVAPPSSEISVTRNHLAQQQADLVRQGAEMVRAWLQRFPKGTLPFALVRLGGESNTLLRWRCSGAGCRPRGGRFELERVVDLIAGLPAAVRARILEVEKARIELNYRYAMTTYALARLDNLERHRIALAQLRRSGLPANSDRSRRV